MKRLFSMNLVLLLCFSETQWIKARQQMAVLEGDDLTRKINDSISEKTLISGDKIRSLLLNQCNIDSISKKDFGSEIDLSNINLQMNNIKKIDSDAFSNFVRLEIVDLSRNDIKMIQKELFQHNVNLTTLDLSYNSIEAIEEKAFVNLIELYKFSLHQNPLKQLKSEIFRGNRKLKFLDLAATQLNHLNDSLFQNTELTYLKLDGNEIVNISEHLFQNNNKLITLTLNSNRIKVVHQSVFQMLNTVAKLNLETNYISDLNEDCFNNMTALQLLNLSNNNISALSPNLFSRNTKLFDLNINNNSITSLPVGLFRNNTRMVTLSLKQNQLTTVTDENFKMNAVLSHLILSMNQISHLDALAFDRLHELEYLDLQHNEIADLPNKIFYTVRTSLKNLFLNDNQVKKINKNMFSVGMKELQILNLSHNNLSECDFYDYEYFPKLKTLHLNNNKLHRVSTLFTDLGENIPSLKNLYLEFNEIEFIYDVRAAVSMITSYEFLNMSNNKITEFNPYFLPTEPMNIIIDVRNNKILRGVGFFRGETHLRGNFYIWESIIPMENIMKMNSVEYYGHGKVLKINKYDLTVSAMKKSIEEIECEDDLIIVSLVIQENHLKQIDCLSNVWTLHFINFSYNDLTTLTKKQFAKMVYLETLDISQNLLTSLDLNIFTASVKLTKFYFDECEVVYSWQYYQITEMFRNLTHISMQNNSIYCPLVSTIIQKYQNSNITIEGYKKDDKIVFDSVDGISCEDYQSIKDILILIVCSNNFIIVEIIIIVLSIVHCYNKRHN